MSCVCGCVEEVVRDWSNTPLLRPLFSRPDTNARRFGGAHSFGGGAVGEELKPVFVVCLDTKDNPTESAKMGRRCAKLCWELEKVEDLEEGFGRVVEGFGKEMEKVRSCSWLVFRAGRAT